MKRGKDDQSLNAIFCTEFRLSMRQLARERRAPGHAEPKSRPSTASQDQQKGLHEGARKRTVRRVGIEPTT
jgi:hypothetical protein